jgi:hypothetical protein
VEEHSLDGLGFGRGLCLVVGGGLGLVGGLCLDVVVPAVFAAAASRATRAPSCASSDRIFRTPLPR